MPARLRARRVCRRCAKPRGSRTRLTARPGQAPRIRRCADGQAHLVHQPGNHPPLRRNKPASRLVPVTRQPRLPVSSPMSSDRKCLQGEAKPGWRFLFRKDVTYQRKDIGNRVQIEHICELLDVLRVAGSRGKRLHCQEVLRRSREDAQARVVENTRWRRISARCDVGACLLVQPRWAGLVQRLLLVLLQVLCRAV